MDAEIISEERLNPYEEEKLSPQHLELLFPATFYKSDEDLSLHLTESCLIETLAWEGDRAVDETAFWLKVLSTPQSDYLKQQKKLFKLAIAEQCRNISKTYTKPRHGIEPEVITMGLKKATHQSVEENVVASNDVTVTATAAPPQRKMKQIIKFTKDESGQQVGVIESIPDETEGTIITENEWDLIEKHLRYDQNQESVQTTSTVAMEIENESTTPGFGIKTIKCRHCDFSTDNRASLQKHQKLLHANELPYSCDRCDYTSKYAWSVKTHIDNVHLKTKRFQCPDCDYATSQACFLKRHTIRKHNPEEGAYLCSYCPYRAHHPNTLQRHVNRQHTQNFAHKCPYCDFGRDCKYLVEDHINDVHLKKVVYKCSECSFQTYKQRALKSHHKTHEHKSVMQCSECEFKSVTTAGLKRHMKSEHPDQKDAIATIVGANESKRMMSSVMSSHDGKEFTAVVMGKCKFCEYATENLIKLKAHVRRIHKKQLPCSKCDFVAKNTSALNRHTASEHPKRTSRPGQSIQVTTQEGTTFADIIPDTAGTQVTVEEGVHIETVEKIQGGTVELVEGLEGIVVVQTEADH